jgi:four helix bundle protein
MFVRELASAMVKPENAVMGSTSYQDLVAWQQAVNLIDQVYASTRDWPRDEIFGLTSQTRRAVVSVAANIAEGQGRNGDREFVNHLGIAHGSLCEVETLIVVARRQDYLSSDIEQNILSQCRRVGGLIKGLKRSLSSAN